MRRSQPVNFVLVLLAGLALVVFASPVQAQGGAGMEPKAVEFESPDYVSLKGTFYPSTQGKNAPTVLMLHAIGEDSKKSAWQELARALQKKGYAVLAFDFRGHGDSTKVKVGKPNLNPKLHDPGFWDPRENQQGIRGYNPNKPKAEIHYKEFTPAYHRILLNDITAAKHYLDGRDDCNSGNLILIGAKDGAALGAKWLNSEWHRYPTREPIKDPRFQRVFYADLNSPQGVYVTACVWLSITDTVAPAKGGGGGYVIDVFRMLDVPARQKGTPTAFFYAKGDDKGKKLAVACENKIKGNDKKKYPFTGIVEIKTNDKIAGSALLVPSLGTEKAIVNYLDDVQKETKLPDAKGRYEKTDYIWQVQTSTVNAVQAVARYNNKPYFHTYDIFR